MVATEDILITKMIESFFLWYTDHVMLHEVLTADHYEPGEVCTVIEILILFSNFSAKFSVFPAWSGYE